MNKKTIESTGHILTIPEREAAAVDCIARKLDHLALQAACLGLFATGSAIIAAEQRLQDEWLARRQAEADLLALRQAEAEGGA